MKITVNPETQSSGDFGYAEANQYTLRVKKCDQVKGQNYPYLKWEFEFANAEVESVEKNKDGTNKQLGSIFENTTLKNTKPSDQFALRNLCDALGLTWGDFDTDDIVGMEFEAKVKIKDYEGTLSNEIAKYIPRE